jgi:hypothetical protein
MTAERKAARGRATPVSSAAVRCLRLQLGYISIGVAQPPNTGGITELQCRAADIEIRVSRVACGFPGIVAWQDRRDFFFCCRD